MQKWIFCWRLHEKAHVYSCNDVSSYLRMYISIRKTKKNIYRSVTVFYLNKMNFSRRAHQNYTEKNISD